MKTELTSVWIISKYGSPSKYGVTSKPYRTARYLSEKGIATLLISSDSNHLAKYPNSKIRFNFEREEKLIHVWIKTLKYKRSASIRRIMSWLAFEWHLFRLEKNELIKPEIVIVSSLSLLSILNGLLLKKKYNCKLVFEIRDIYPLTLTEELGVSASNPLVYVMKKVEKKGYGKSDLIVGTMPNLEEHVKDVLGYDKRVFFSPLGINDYWNNTLTKSKQVDDLFTDCHDSIIVGYSGSMGITNALESYISAIEQLQYRTDLFFIFIGQGDLKEKYRQRLMQFDNVVFGPKINQDEVPYFLSKCDILYLSTFPTKIWNYGQSMNKLVDYMMAGKPTVASYSGYPSMLNEASSGVFVEPNSVEAIIEAIITYANMDRVDRQAIGQRGKEWIMANYDNNTVCRRYLDEMLRLLGGDNIIHENTNLG